MRTWFPLALVSIAIGAVGQLLLKLASRSAGPLPLLGPGMFGALGRLLTNGYLVTGLLCFVLSMLLWVKVLSNAELSSTYPLVSLGYVLVAVMSWVVLGERLSLRQGGAIAIIIAGVLLLGHR